MNCRHCRHPLTVTFLDLCTQPPSNSFLTIEQLKEPETFYPLLLYVCEKCFLVQLDESIESSNFFNSQYAYFSSVSTSWVEHAKQYVKMIIGRLQLNSSSFVIEVASNDGYLLQHFKKMGIPCLGIEPSSNTAKIAMEKGLDCLTEFMTTALARELAASGKMADLVLGNNVLAHVPDVNDFVRSLKILLRPEGVITIEFPHLLELISNQQFDTIYHEHYSYLSLTTTQTIFTSSGLKIFDVEKLDTHGGSLRIYATHIENERFVQADSVERIKAEEENAGITSIDFYTSFQTAVDKTKDRLLFFLLEQKNCGKKVIAYGAAAKGNTFLNTCGIKRDLLPCCIDKSPFKQGLFMPGSHIPVLSSDQILITRPDYILILPWNIKDEITAELAYVREWGCKFVTAIPHLSVF